VTVARFRSPPAPPNYPKRAVAMSQEGVAIVRALIDAEGNAREIRLWRSSGFTLLDEAALQAVRGWAFEPARSAGRAVTAWVEIPVNFQLR
jgi:protein TonB